MSLGSPKSIFTELAGLRPVGGNTKSQYTHRYKGYRLHSSGSWSKDSELVVRGGQSMLFRIKNINVLGTTINIEDNFGKVEGRIIPPFVTAEMTFDLFGCEPVLWKFQISTNSDAFIVTWQLFSTWIPGDSRNC